MHKADTLLAARLRMATIAPRLAALPTPGSNGKDALVVAEVLREISLALLPIHLAGWARGRSWTTEEVLDAIGAVQIFHMQQDHYAMRGGQVVLWRSRYLVFVTAEGVSYPYRYATTAPEGEGPEDLTRYPTGKINVIKKNAGALVTLGQALKEFPEMEPSFWTSVPCDATYDDEVKAYLEKEGFTC